MSISLKYKDLLDRINEVDYIFNDIMSLNENKVLILWSDSGIGKSSLIDKLSLKSFGKKILVRIDTPPININEIAIAGQYISYIAQTFDKALSQYDFSMSAYLSSGYNERIKAKETSKIISNISKLPLILMNIFSDKVLGLGDMDSEYILNSTDTDSILVDVQYIEMALNIFDIIVNITNIQNIDSLSLSILNDMFQKTNNNYYIFEYTTINSNTDNLYRIYQQIKRNTLSELMYLDKLPFEEVVTLIGDKYSVSSSDLFNYYTETVKGNLFKIRSLENCTNSTKVLQLNSDSTAVIISKLSHASKIWLYIICLHDGNLSIDLFMHIIDYIREQFYFDDQKIWKEIDCLIDKTEINIMLKHASICDNVFAAQMIDSLATFELLCKYYTNILENNIFIYCTKKNAILRIITLYSRYSPQNILNYMNYLRDVIISSISLEQASSIIKKVYDSISDSKDELKFNIISLCYSIGLYKEAYSFLETIHKHTDTYIALKCALLNRLDHHEEFIELYNEYKYKRRNSDRLNLILDIFYILSNKSMSNITKCEFMFDKIRKTQEYFNIYEYGFFLRNSQILLPYSESIPFIEESISFFENRHATDDADNSRLTLAVQFARLGYIERANDIINNIRDRLMAKTFERHIIYNNEAAIKLLIGNTNDTVFLLLEKAYITATTGFDKLSILNNQLCWLIDNKVNDVRFENIQRKITDLLKFEPDKRLHKRSYINISQYYYLVKSDLHRSQDYLQTAQAIEIEGDSLNMSFLNKNSGLKDLLFQAEKDYLVSFIIYWHFDIPML